MTIQNIRTVLNCPTRAVPLVGGPLDGKVIRIPFGPEIYRHLMRSNGVVYEYDVSKDIGQFLGEVGFEGIKE